MVSPPHLVSSGARRIRADDSRRPIMVIRRVTLLVGLAVVILRQVCEETLQYANGGIGFQDPLGWMGWDGMAFVWLA